MAFCPNCGKQVEDGAKFCPNCGQSLGQTQPSPSSSDDVEAVAYCDRTNQIGVIIDGILVGQTSKLKPLKFVLTRGAHKVTLSGPRGISYTKDMEFLVSAKASKITLNVKWHLGAFRNSIKVDSIVES